MTQAAFDHHRATIDRATARLRAREDVIAVLVGGSIAHGFATMSSDVDLLIVVSEPDWERRLAAGDMTELDLESATYDGGYVDGKYTSVGFIRAVADHGSENARFAFDGATIAWSRIDGLEQELTAAARYPIEGQADRIRAFHAHLEYWRWMFAEGDRAGNAYVKALAAPHVVLFAGRLILTHNAVLYPGYKWLVRVLRGVERQPRALIDAMDAVIDAPDKARVDSLFDLVTTWRDWGVAGQHWAAKFIRDTELAWLDARPPIADL
ncbi:MAG: nucleotidyltransferase domain-containing protein [Chloroflexota bacterium]